MKNVSIIYETLNLDVLFSGPYYRDVRDYNHANNDNIQGLILEFDRLSSNRNGNEKLNILIDILLTVIKNFIRHKIQGFD